MLRGDLDRELVLFGKVSNFDLMIEAEAQPSRFVARKPRLHDREAAELKESEASTRDVANEELKGEAQTPSGCDSLKGRMCDREATEFKQSEACTADVANEKCKVEAQQPPSRLDSQRIRVRDREAAKFKQSEAFTADVATEEFEAEAQQPPPRILNRLKAQVCDTESAQFKQSEACTADAATQEFKANAQQPPSHLDDLRVGDLKQSEACTADTDNEKKKVEAEQTPFRLEERACDGEAAEGKNSKSGAETLVQTTKTQPRHRDYQLLEVQQDRTKRPRLLENLQQADQSQNPQARYQAEQPQKPDQIALATKSRCRERQLQQAQQLHQGEQPELQQRTEKKKEWKQPEQPSQPTLHKERPGPMVRFHEMLMDIRQYHLDDPPAEVGGREQEPEEVSYQKRLQERKPQVGEEQEQKQVPEEVRADHPVPQQMQDHKKKPLSEQVSLGSGSWVHPQPIPKQVQEMVEKQVLQKMLQKVRKDNEASKTSELVVASEESDSPKVTSDGDHLLEKIFWNKNTKLDNGRKVTKRAVCEVGSSKASPDASSLNDGTSTVSVAKKFKESNTLKHAEADEERQFQEVLRAHEKQMNKEKTTKKKRQRDIDWKDVPLNDETFKAAIKSLSGSAVESATGTSTSVAASTGVPEEEKLEIMRAKRLLRFDAPAQKQNATGAGKPDSNDAIDAWTENPTPLADVSARDTLDIEMGEKAKVQKRLKIKSSTSEDIQECTTPSTPGNVSKKQSKRALPTTQNQDAQKRPRKRQKGQVETVLIDGDILKGNIMVQWFDGRTTRKIGTEDGSSDRISRKGILVSRAKGSEGLLKALPLGLLSTVVITRGAIVRLHDNYVHDGKATIEVKRPDGGDVKILQVFLSKFQPSALKALLDCLRP